MHNKLFVFICAALCSLSVSAVHAAELTALLPKSAAGFETEREPRLRTLTSGAERAMLSYYGEPGSLRLWITDVGAVAPDVVQGFQSRVAAGDLERHEWQGLPLFTETTKMRRDQFLDAFLPAGRLVVWLRLTRDNEKGDLSADDVMPVLEVLGAETLRSYGTGTEPLRVLYDPFARVEPQPPVDAATLASFLPAEAAGTPRGEVEQKASGYGKKARAMATAGYGDGAAIIIVDQGGIPTGLLPLLREAVHKGTLAEDTLASQPLFVRIGPGDLPRGIEVPGALVVTEERFLVMADTPGDEPQTAQSRALAAAVDLKGLAALRKSLVDRDTFRERFRTCEPANFVTAPAYNAGYRYEILGPVDGGCQVRGQYTRTPNSDLVGPTMTCTWDNRRPFDEVMKNIDACEGPLRQQMAH
ncbi:hypothetical protein Q6D67_07490 [Haliea sp. E1-2-M8]|uniref:hypothetical protein n=1 Tax=Haliea sp. E1-2-M8 TaxID=3064706 RepID=UPI002719B9A0|nr:hypothetical protein [Haliea sp. E1-2-M8]MDO8861541.1 hypothetical protein [Haliea sp. E1-2-M8]